MAKDAPSKADTAQAPKAFKPALLLLLLLPAAALMLPMAIVLAAALVPSLVARLVGQGRRVRASSGDQPQRTRPICHCGNRRRVETQEGLSRRPRVVPARHVRR